MFAKIKPFLIDHLLKSKECWRNNGRVKIMIATNAFFTTASWQKKLTKFSSIGGDKWDIVFCENRSKIYGHFESADICFLFGLGKYLESKRPENKFIYFPVMGTEFLDDTKLDESVKIEKPSVVSPPAIAEYCYAMAIMLIRNFHQAILSQASRKWTQKNLLEHFKPLTAHKIGIMGLGNVGIELARYFNGHGCVVCGFSDVKPSDVHELTKWYGPEELEPFLNEADLLINALPLTETTRDLIRLKEIELLGPSKFIISISRGGIINEKDLLFALKNRIIRGAALDVFGNEPLPARSPFYSLDNVIITPHIAGNINLFVEEIQQDFIEKAMKYIEDV